MGSSSDFLIKMESDNKETSSNHSNKQQPPSAVTAKKFSPFSVDSLLATKVKQSQNENNNDETIEKRDSKVLRKNDAETEAVVDLSLKSSGSDQEIKKEEDLDQEDFTDDDDQEELDEDCDNDSIGTSTSCQATTVLNPHARFPLGLPLTLPPVPNSTWNPVTNPWLSPQFRSPLNPFLPRKYICKP